MKGKLYIVSAPRFIFDGLTPAGKRESYIFPTFKFPENSLQATDKSITCRTYTLA